MADSDTDSGGEWEFSTKTKYLQRNIILTFRPSEVIFDKWHSLPADQKSEATQRMRVCSFWLPILLQRDDSVTALWAAEIGLISSKTTEDLKLKHLRKIEVVEAILLSLEKGTMKKESTRDVLAITNTFQLHCSLEVYEKALRWLEAGGDNTIRQRLKELGSPHVCLTALHFIFTEYAKFIQKLGGSTEKTLKALFIQLDDYHIEKSDRMKKEGNEYFQKNNFEVALEFYTKAITYCPDNHIIYGNRALCYIRCQKYLKAVGDGKRAILIKPHWAKGHYRFCEALFYLGEYHLALTANSSASALCKSDPEGFNNLAQQKQKFLVELRQMKVPLSKKVPGFKTGVGVKTPQLAKASVKPPSATNKSTKATEAKMDKKTGKNEKTSDPEGKIKDLKSTNSETAESNNSGKKKAKGKSAEEVSRKVADARKELKSLVEDAYTALYDQRSRNAEEAFCKVMALMKTFKMDLGLSKLDLFLLMFGHASALADIGHTEKLIEAEKLLETLRTFEFWTFQSLVYFGMGRVFLRQNRFARALQQFLDALQMVKKQITPGKHTWPLTKEVVKETDPKYFKETLENFIDLCRFPPPPDAVCRLDKCLYPKTEIYFTDPDFKGFIQLCCCHKCSVEFHITCWKTVKTTVFAEKSEKDILNDPCLTPDCFGQIFCIKIFGPTGLVKCKFETAVVKPEVPKKPKVNQKCTSLKKVKSKEERKLERKQHKQSHQDQQTISNDLPQQKEKSKPQSPQKAWVLYRDRSLLQIYQNMELFRADKNVQVSVFICRLKPWLELDFQRGNQIAEKLLNFERESVKTLGQAAELLLERKNRVWAQIFIQQLCNCVDIDPKLVTWSRQLNNLGLKASKSFIEHYADHLEQLDLSPLLKFGPLQDLLLDRLGSRPELFSGVGLSMTDYLKQALPEDMRLFIWTLEEYRDGYVSCHSILDEYFDMTDEHSVFKKSDENISPVKPKSRGRKKRKREVAFFRPGSVGAHSREELDQDFFDDESLSFLHPSDAFSVPNHLREQVADFEQQYGGGRQTPVLDNNHDPVKESLYDYFSNILDEHGPLMPDDPLLVGEMQHFPDVSKRLIEAVGSFDAFLLQSFRFRKIGSRIGLAQHLFPLQEVEPSASLDELDYITASNTSPSPYVDGVTENGFYFESYSLPNPFTGLNPYANEFQSTAAHYLPWSEREANLITPPPHNFLEELELDVLDVLDSLPSETDSVTSTVSSLTTPLPLLKKDAEAQVSTKHLSVTSLRAMRSVAMNTEFDERLEKCPGGLNKKVKHHNILEQQISEAKRNSATVDPKGDEDISACEQEIKQITAHIQVTNKELMIFQKKLEEEVKKDQKEKKANQEILKTLKTEIEQLDKEQASLKQSIQTSKKSYDAKLRDFLELSNQSAAQKMSLEDEIRRCQTLISSGAHRSQAAKRLLAETERDCTLWSLHKERTEAKAFLDKLDEALQRVQNHSLEVARKECKSKFDQVEKKISVVEQQFREQIGQLKVSSRSSGEKLTNNNNSSNHAKAAASSTRTVPAPAPPMRRAPSPAAEAVAAHNPPSRKWDPPPITVFDRAMESLTSMFPGYSRLDLLKYIQEVRVSRGGTLNNMNLEDVVATVTQLILDHQERLSAAGASARAAGRGSPAHRSTPPLVPPAPVWQPVTNLKTPSTKALNVEDPCIICHEDMSPDDTSVLECRHSFHTECIKSWLKEQSTCPTCRTHALLNDDFPMLPGRKRHAP